MQNTPIYSSTTRNKGCLEQSFWGGIGAIAAVATLIVAIISIPQAAPIRQVIYQTISGTTTFTPTPSSQILPTPPLTIPCIQGPCNLAGTVTLTSIDLDKANQKMTWHFHITAMADGTFGFSQLYLEDPSTTMYQAGGQVNDKWTKKSGDSTDESPTFGFYPQRATSYKLYLVLLVISSGVVGNTGVNYETETFTFNT